MDRLAFGGHDKCSLYIAQGMLRTSFIPEGLRAVQLTLGGFQLSYFVSPSVVVLVVFSMQSCANVVRMAPCGMCLMMGQSEQESQEHTLPSSLRGTPTCTRMSAMLAITISAKATAMTCGNRTWTLGFRAPRAPQRTPQKHDAQAV